MTLQKILALAIVLVLWAQPAAAQNGNGERIKLDFQNAELADVIRTIAQLTKKNFLFDDRVRGTVTVISEKAVTLDEAYRVFEAVLQVKGFSVIEGPGGVLKIIPSRDAAQSPLPIEDEGSPTSNRDKFITRLIPLRYVKVDTITDTFRQLTSKEASLIAYAPTNTLILTDTAANIRRVLNIVAEIDVSTYEEQIKVIPVQFADAADLTGQLREIFSTDAPGRTPATTGAAAAARARAAARAAANAAAAGGVGASAGGTFGVAGEPRFIPDQRTNSIIVLAPQATIRQVERLITLLDYQRPGTGRINIIRLQNADAEEMAQTLSDLVQNGSSGSAGGAPGANAGAAAAVVELEGGVRITADAPTNSLIIQSSPESFAALSEVIRELDTRRPQVLIEALIMEINVTDSQAFSTQILFNTLFGSGGRDPSQQRIGGFGSNPLRDNMGGGQAFATPPLLANGNFAPFTGTILGRSLTIIDAMGNPQQIPVIQGVITASENNSDVDIISSPAILTADNEEAQIVVGATLGFPTTRLQAADPTGGAAQNAFQTSSNIERRDVGVTLRVTPQISEGETVKLDFFQEVSQVTDPTNAFGPTTSNRTVENTVFVKNGEAVMIGGIIQDQLTKSASKVPFLGDIPIIGFAFRSTNDTVLKTNLLVILTPHIVRDPLDLEELTVENRERFRSLSGGLPRTDEELEAREKAQRAGISLPLDSNPVRRELESLDRASPVENLPALRREQSDRERKRLARLQEASAPAGRYVVQVALLRDAQAAAMLLEKLMSVGYDGTVLSRDENGDTLHFVQLGPYPDEEEAQRVSREVRAETGLNALVMVEPR